MSNIKRILKDIESVYSNLDNYDQNIKYYYDYNDSDITKGIILLLGVDHDETGKNKRGPYYGGFYFFENKFSDTYPFSPLKLKFLSNDGRTRYNPNLYQLNSEGKVCLSILGTWGESSWTQVQRLSSVLEIIRAHLFVENPLLNEPGYNKSDPSCEIYERMIYYQNLNFNIYNNIIQTPKYAQPFKKIMCLDFLKNKEYFQEYINKNKHLHGKQESIRYDSQTVYYDFITLQKKYDEILKESLKY